MMMLSRSLLRRVVVPGRRLMSTEGKLSLSFAAPHSSLYHAAPVDSVVCRALPGEYGVTAGHSPLVEELKPGVVAVTVDGKTDKYFVSGGFAITDPDKTDVSVAEAVALEDLDKDKVTKAYAAAKAGLDAATDDDKPEATLKLEAAKSMATALGLAV